MYIARVSFKTQTHKRILCNIYTHVKCTLHNQNGEFAHLVRNKKEEVKTKEIQSKFAK